MDARWASIAWRSRLGSSSSNPRAWSSPATTVGKSSFSRASSSAPATTASARWCSPTDIAVRTRNAGATGTMANMARWARGSSHSKTDVSKACAGRSLAATTRAAVTRCSTEPREPVDRRRLGLEAAHVLLGASQVPAPEGDGGEHRFARGDELPKSVPPAGVDGPRRALGRFADAAGSQEMAGGDGRDPCLPQVAMFAGQMAGIDETGGRTGELPERDLHGRQRQVRPDRPWWAVSPGRVSGGSKQRESVGHAALVPGAHPVGGEGGRPFVI